MDERLTEVTFGVTINVYRLMEVTFKRNDAQLWLIVMCEKYTVILLKVMCKQYGTL